MVWTTIIAPVMLAMSYHIDITGLIVWTIISAYILQRVYNELLFLPYRYTWDNKSVLPLYCNHAYNHIAILLQNVI